MENKKLFFTLGLVGLAGMIIQIGLLNSFLNFFPQSSMVTGVTIGGWIIGLGIGGIMLSKKDRLKNPNKYISIFQYLLGISVLLFALNSGTIFKFFYNLRWFAMPLALIFVTGVGALSGTTFLLVNSFYKKDKDKTTAKLYSIENFGAGISSIIAGILLLPLIGIKLSLISSSLLCLGIGFNFTNKKKIISYLPLLVLPMLVISMVSANDFDFQKQSPYGEVRIIDNKLIIGQRMQCDFLELNQSEREIVKYSLDTLENPSVLNVGLGCGVTLSEILKYTDKETDVVEINKVVVEANLQKTSILLNKRINVIIDDGVTYMRDTDKKYDSIIIDIENPGVIHSSNLYTKEGFSYVKNSLKENGVFGLWVYPCSQGNYYDIYYWTLRENFENVYLIGDRIFLASDKPLNYQDYVPSSEKEINTMDKKVLSSWFLNKCWTWQE